MNTDFTPYLLDVYVHSKQIADWENRPEKLNDHLKAVEKWWNRLMQDNQRPSPGVSYMMLAYLNMLKGYVFSMQTDGLDTEYYKRIFQLQGQIIEEMPQKAA